MQYIKVDTVTGTGNAINVSLGWEPQFVMIVNATDGDIVDMWFNGMSAGTAISIAAAAATRASNGVTAYAGSTTAAKGFTIGSGISENAKVLFYIAIGEGDGNG